MPEAKANKDLIESLRAVKSSIQEKHSIWEDTDDVMDKNFTRRSKKRRLSSLRKVVDDSLERGFRFQNFSFPVEEFVHLPRGTVEPWSEYIKRVRLTPFFPETPGIVASRRGAMFASKPVVKIDDSIEPFLKTIGPRRQNYHSVLDFISTRTYTFGFMAVLVDFRPLPDDIRARVSGGEQLSQAEIEQQGLNQPVLGLFVEREILDFAYDRKDGRLLWIKLLEKSIDRSGGWENQGKEIELYRVIDRTEIRMFEISETSGGTEVVTEFPPIKHDARNVDDDPEVPVVLINPNGHKDQIGDSAVRLSVQADLTALRLLSDVIWNAYVHGNMQLVLSTPNPDDDERAEEIGLGASRYVTIRAADPMTNQGGEELFYLQPQTGGLELLTELHKGMIDKANELASRTTPNASTKPVAMSGVAKAWDFKTTEEKALHEHVAAIEQASNEILKMLTRRLHRKGVISGTLESMTDDVRTSFDPAFDIADPEFNIKINDMIHQIAKEANLPEMQIAALRRLDKSLPNLSDNERKGLNDDLDKKLEELKKLAKEGVGVVGAKTDEGTLNAQAMAIRTLVDIGDFELANDLRLLLATEHGLPPPAPLVDKEEISNKNFIERVAPESSDVEFFDAS